MADITTNARLTNLENRREENVGKQVDNASLYAGSPMYYYCHGCGAQTAVKPEGWVADPPPRFCDPCKELVEAGDMRADEESYDLWLAGHGHGRVRR